MTQKEIDAMADEFLRENDPYYTDRRAKKSRKYEYPYHTPQQQDAIRCREYPFSSLSVKQAQTCIDQQCDLGVSKREF